MCHLSHRRRRRCSGFSLHVVGLRYVKAHNKVNMVYKMFLSSFLLEDRIAGLNDVRRFY